MTTLFTNPLGFKFDRTDYKNRSKVKVHNNGYNLRTYRFNNVECFESPYISWQNLDQCGGWATKDDYLKTAVQNGTKLFAQIIHDSRESFDSREDIVVNTQPHKWLKDECETHICRKGCLSDYYDIDAVVDHYSRLGISFRVDELQEYFNVELSVFGTDEAPFKYIRCKNNVEFVITGLLLGYPLESTASIIQGY